MSKQWFTAQELAGLPGMPGTDRGVREWNRRGLIGGRKRAKGKGREYAVASLPAETQIAIHAERIHPNGGISKQSKRRRNPANRRELQATAALIASVGEQQRSVARALDSLAAVLTAALDEENNDGE